jgi:hypothetical protein
MRHYMPELSLDDSHTPPFDALSLRLEQQVEAGSRMGPDAESISFEFGEIWAGGRPVSVSD